MKRIFFLILLVFSIIILSSCQQIILHNSKWEGNINGIYQRNNTKLTMEFPYGLLYDDNISVEIDINSMKIPLKGTYYIKGDYNFHATLDYTYYKDLNFNKLLFPILIIIDALLNPDDVSSIEYYISMDGYLNYNSGIGEGDYYFKSIIHKKNGSTTVSEYRKNWDAEKYKK
jgi:hypothetical protein